MSASATSLVVIVPVFNEATLIGDVVDETARVLAGRSAPWRILVLDDASTDWSDVLEQRLLSAGPVSIQHFAKNGGKGAVLGRVFPELTDDLIVVIDADGEYPPADIPAVLGPLEGDEADWVFGSRYGFGRPRPTQYRATWFVNRLINLWFGVLSGRYLSDILSGHYALRTELVRDLQLREGRFAYVPELVWWVFRRRGVRIAEVPIAYRFRRYAAGKKIRWWETGTILWATLRYAVRTG